MLLAEALIERKVLKNKIGELVMTIEDIAVIQEGDKEPKIDEMLVDLQNMHDQFANIDSAIRVTNWQTVLEGGISLAAAIANRDALKLMSGSYNNLAGRHYNRRQFRRSATEIKFKDLLDREAMAKTRDEFAQVARELDAKIQAKNWTTELLK
jgi:hypothetical protein